MDGSSNVRVAVRVRPYLPRELRRESKCIVRMSGNTTTLLKPDATDAKKDSKVFAFDFSFWSFHNANGAAVQANVANRDVGLPYVTDANQVEVPAGANVASNATIFQLLGTEVVNNAFNGLNATVFAYGQTGAGKSFTMMGMSGDAGLTPRFCEELFRRVTESEAEGKGSIQVEISFMEIYNERVKDLLGVGKDRDALKVRSHPTTGPYVEGLSKFAVRDYQRVEQLLDLGNQSRTVGSTAMNDQSSRSHSVFTITVTQTRVDPDTNEKLQRQSKVHLVDLAGSERADRTGAQGQRLREGANINKSLSALGKVISTLAESTPGSNVHVPYRDSVLTWLLCQSLGGNSKTIMLANISPTDADYDETLSTLRYADNAKRIVNRVTVNESKSVRVVLELKAEIERLRAELAAARDTTPTVIADQLRESERLWQETKETWEERLKESQKELEARTQQLHELGLGNRKDERTPCLVNLNEDPLMSECLIYPIVPGRVTRVGREEADIAQDVLLAGLNIEPEHCIFDNTSDIVTITPVGTAVTYVNGQRLTGTRDLQQYDRVIMGLNHTFRFQYPTSSIGADLENIDEADSGENRTRSVSVHSQSNEAMINGERVNWEFARRELVTAGDSMFASLLSSPGLALSTEEQRVIEDKLVGIYNLTNEANAISQALRKTVAFEPVLVSATSNHLVAKDDSKTTVAVRVRHIDSDRASTWTEEKFRNRMFTIRDLWLRHNPQKNIVDTISRRESTIELPSSRSGLELPDEDDPFEDFGEDKLLGIANLYLQPLIYGITVSRLLPIIDNTSNQIHGHLQVTLQRDPLTRVAPLSEYDEDTASSIKSGTVPSKHLGHLKRLSKSQDMSLVSCSSSESELPGVDGSAAMEDALPPIVELKDGDTLNFTLTIIGVQGLQANEVADCVCMFNSTPLTPKLPLGRPRSILSQTNPLMSTATVSSAELSSQASVAPGAQEKLKKRFSTGRSPVISLGSSELAFGAMLSHTERFSLPVTGAFLRHLEKAALALEVYGRVGTYIPPAIVPSRSQLSAEGHKRLVEYIVSPDICELDYTGLWAPCPVKLEVCSGSARKVFRVHHGQQRQLMLKFCWGDGDHHADEEQDHSFLPAYAIETCTAVHIVSAREAHKDVALDSSEDDLNSSAKITSSTRTLLPILQAKSTRRSCTIVATLDPAVFNFPALCVPTTSQHRLVVGLEMELRLSASTPVSTITLSKEIFMKVYLRDAEFDVGVTAETLAMYRKLDWRFQVECLRAGPKGFIVTDALEGATEVLKAHAEDVKTLEAVMLVDRYKQELELIRTLRARGFQNNLESQIHQLNFSIDQVEPVAQRSKRSSETQLKINEINGTTPTAAAIRNLPPSKTKPMTHARMSGQLHELNRELTKEQKLHYDTKHRLFCAQALSVKLMLMEQSRPIQPVHIEDLFEQAMRDRIPVAYWPHWIQVQLDAEYKGSKTIPRENSPVFKRT